MNNFNFNLPTEIHFGRDVENKAGELCKKFGKKNVLILCDAFLKDSELLCKVENSLEDNGISFITMADVLPNPVVSDIRRRTKIAVENDVDFTIGLGGGSAIDIAKAVAFCAASPDVDPMDFFTHKYPVTKTLGCAAILTIAATGSENSFASMATLDEIPEKLKTSVPSPLNRPLFALMNPENTYTLPKFQVAVGIADIMMHTIDRYFSANCEGNHLTDEIAEGLLRTTISNGAIAMKDSYDYTAMSELMWCGSLSHNNLTNLGRPIDMTVHQIGNIFSGVYNATHGACVAILWPAFARYVYENNIPRFAQYARNIWGIDTPVDSHAAVLGIDATQHYFVNVLGIPATFRDLGIDMNDEDIRKLAYDVSGQNTRKLGTFKPLDAADIYEIYKAASGNEQK